MKKILVSITIYILLCSLIFATNINSKAGTSAFEFLKIGIGARPMSMGKAFVGISDDINSLYWNPAGISQISTKRICFSYSYLLAEIMYGFLGFVYPINKKYIVGTSLAYLYSGEIQGYDKDNKPSGPFTTNDFSLNISCGYKLAKKLYTGATLKFLQERLENISASGYAGDFGIIYKISEIVKVGATIRNIGPSVTFLTESFNLPTSYNIGCGIFLLEKTLNIGIAYNYPIDYNSEVCLGIEYILKEIVAFRFGYKYQFTDTAYYDGLSNVSAGIGVKLLNFTFDYAFIPYGVLGNTHYVSLSLGF